MDEKEVVGNWCNISACSNTTAQQYNHFLYRCLVWIYYSGYAGAPGDEWVELLALRRQSVGAIMMVKGSCLQMPAGRKYKTNEIVLPGMLEFEILCGSSENYIWEDKSDWFTTGLQPVWFGMIVIWPNGICWERHTTYRFVQSAVMLIFNNNDNCFCIMMLNQKWEYYIWMADQEILSEKLTCPLAKIWQEKGE